MKQFEAEVATGISKKRNNLLFVLSSLNVKIVNSSIIQAKAFAKADPIAKF